MCYCYGFNSYLTNRSQSFTVDSVQSKLIGVDCNVPQVSVLGLLEVNSYTEDVVDVFTSNRVRHHLFADDNALKTELQWFESRVNLRKLSSADLTLSVGNDVIQPVTVIQDLGVYLDNELTMKQHISRVVSSASFS